jgi:hypothetical protein
MVCVHAGVLARVRDGQQVCLNRCNAEKGAGVMLAQQGNATKLVELT